MKLTATITFLFASFLLSIATSAQQQSKSFLNGPSQNAHRLKSLKPTSRTSDLQWLKPVLQNVKYVGLGDVSYGSQETFKVKSKLVQFLIKEMGYTALALEASYSGCKNINNYVMNDIGNPYSALASVAPWTLKNRDMLELIEWMHRYNKSVPIEKKVKFYGFDILVNSEGVANLKHYLQKVDAPVGIANRGVFTDFARIENGWKGDTAAERKEELFHVLQQLQLHKNDYIAASSVLEYQDALQYATVMMQFLDAQLMTDADSRKKDREWRDFYMSSNFDYLIQQDTNAKVVIWAQNEHLNKDSAATVNNSKEPFGSYLKEAYKDQYYAIGIFLNKGSFQTIAKNSNPNKKLQVIKLSAAKPESLESLLSKGSRHNYIVNLRKANEDFRMNDWANKTFETRNVETSISRIPVINYYVSINPSKDFDGLLFIRNSKPTRLFEATQK
jgi:erythromycin esterase